MTSRISKLACLGAGLAISFAVWGCVGAEAAQGTADPTAIVAAATADPTATSPRTSPPSPQPTATPTLDPRAARLCPASALTGTIEGWQGQGGTTTAQILVTNVSTASCGIGGIPEVRMTDGKGRSIPSEPAAVPSAGLGPTFRLPPGGAARTTVHWANWCPDRAPIQPIGVALVLPFGLGSVQAPGTTSAPIPECTLGTGYNPLVGAEPWSL